MRRHLLPPLATLCQQLLVVAVLAVVAIPAARLQSLEVVSPSESGLPSTVDGTIRACPSPASPTPC